METVSGSPATDITCRPYYPALDGLRAIAISLVFWFHYGVPSVAPLSLVNGWGWIGVDLFFVLSGFLITGILFDSVDHSHYFVRFYFRRGLRIFPLYWGFWAVLLATAAIQRVRVPVTFLAFPGYFANLLPSHIMLPAGAKDYILTLGTVAGHPFRMYFGHFWTLCMEEQFYLAWPLVIWLVRDRIHLLWVCGVGIVGVPLLRWGLVTHMSPAWVAGNVIYGSTETRFDTLLVGAAVALLARGSQREIAGLRVTALASIIAGASITGLVLSTRLYVAPTVTAGGLFLPRWLQVYGFTLIAGVAAGVLVLSLRGANWLGRALKWPPLVMIGRMSYGFYVMHMVLFGFMQEAYFKSSNHTKERYSLAVSAYCLTFALSWASFRWYEAKFLQLKGWEWRKGFFGLSRPKTLSRVATARRVNGDSIPVAVSTTSAMPQ